MQTMTCNGWMLYFWCPGFESCCAMKCSYTRNSSDVFSLTQGLVFRCCISLSLSLSITWEACHHWSKLGRVWSGTSASLLGELNPLYLSSNHYCMHWIAVKKCDWELQKTLLYTKASVAPVGEFQISLYFGSNSNLQSMLSVLKPGKLPIWSTMNYLLWGVRNQERKLHPSLYCINHFGS